MSNTKKASKFDHVITKTMISSTKYLFKETRESYERREKEPLHGFKCKSKKNKPLDTTYTREIEMRFHCLTNSNDDDYR